MRLQSRVLSTDEQGTLNRTSELRLNDTRHKHIGMRLIPGNKSTDPTLKKLADTVPNRQSAKLLL
jgi:hypothetical protein